MIQTPEERMQQLRLLKPIRNHPLTQQSYQELMTTLQGFGNTHTESQQAALKNMLNAFTQTAIGNMRGRHGYPLPCGFGKTTGIITWVSTLIKLGYQHISVVICCSKIEALCEIKRELVKAGVSEEKVGLLHTYTHDEKKAKAGVPRYASLPATKDNENRQILLASHNRLRSNITRGSDKVDRYYTYRGRKRNLIIWDETLFSSDSTSLPVRLIRKGIGALQGWSETELEKESATYFSECLDIINFELESQQEGNAPAVINLPSVSGERVNEYFDVCNHKDIKNSTQDLRDLLELTQENLRVIDNEGTGVISFQIVVPEELNNIIILDASHSIRKLVAFDETIKTAVPSDIELVSYKNVTGYWMNRASGRYTLTKQFKKRKDSNTFLKEYVHVVKELIPANEGVLIFTFKKRDVDFIEKIRDELRSQGINPDGEIVTTDDETIKKVEVLTWGNETSLNAFRDYSNIIFAGLLHRDYKDLMSAIAGQKNNLLEDVPRDVLKEVQLSEITHGVYQACSRGSCRIYEGRYTKPMKIWIHHKDKELRSYISKVMPDIRWESWKPVCRPETRISSDYIAEQIKAVLENVTRKISIKEIKKLTGLDKSKTHPNTFTAGIKKFLKDNLNWIQEGRSLVPC